MNYSSLQAGSHIKFNEMLALALILIVALLSGCATDSPPIPRPQKSERQLDVDLWGSENIPKDEKLLHIWKSFWQIDSQYLDAALCGQKYRLLREIPGRGYTPWFYMGVTNKATHLFYYESGNSGGSALIPEITWNYSENPIKAELLYDEASKDWCVDITDSHGNRYRFQDSTYRVKRTTRIINYAVEQGGRTSE